MNPVSREMERLGWGYDGLYKWYQKNGTQLRVTYNEAKNAFDKGLLNEYLEDIDKAYRKKRRLRK